MHVQAEPLRALVGDIFAAAGCPSEEAARIARHLVSANLTGHDSHGVIRVPRYLDWIDMGTLVPGQDVTVVAETPVMAVLDGNHGFGQSVGHKAVSLGVDKAAASGVAVIALRNSGHLGRIGDWAELAAEAGQISLHFVNVAGSLLVAPFGGSERRMSTNPVAIGMPRRDGPPMILDFATSVVAEGKVLVAAKGGKALPEDSLIDIDGTLSTDPKVLYGPADPGRAFTPHSGSGSIRAMGEHKGSGLALMCEMLAGALTGSGCAGPDERPIANGMLSVYMAPRFFDSEDAFAAEAERYLAFFRSARPADADGEVLLPGDPERRTRQRRLQDGIPIPEDVRRAIGDAARHLQVGGGPIEAAFGPQERG